MKPTISSVGPAVGHTGGRTLVEITGTGFREPEETSNPSGPAPAPRPSVRVLFGGAEASRVVVAGSDLLWCETPASDPGTVDVVVQNLGETPARLTTPVGGTFPVSPGDTLEVRVAGGEAQQLVFGAGDVGTPGLATPAEVAAVINRARGLRAKVTSAGYVLVETDARGASAQLAVSGGSAAASLGWAAPVSATGSATLEPIEEETATLQAAFTFARPDLSAPSQPTLALRQLVLELRRQVFDNVHVATHTDYDEETGDLLNTAMLASLPAIVLAGIELPESKGRRVLGLHEAEGADGEAALETSPPDLVDMTMALVVVSDSPPELLNLYAILRRVLRKLSELAVPVDPGDASRGTTTYQVSWDLQAPAGMSVTSDNSNIVTMTGAVAIRGIQIGGIPLATDTSRPAWAPPGVHDATRGVTWKNETTEVALVPVAESE